MAKVYAGIDLSSTVCVGAAVNAQGRLVKLEQFNTSEKGIIDFVSKLSGEVVLLMEEGDMTDWAWRAAFPHVSQAIVCCPRQNAWIYKDSNKDDAIDAVKLAHIARNGTYKRIFHSDDDQIGKLVVAVKAYDQMTKRATRLKNQIRARFRTAGLIFPGTRLFGKKGREEALALLADGTLAEVIRADYRLLDFLTVEQAAAKGRFVTLARSHPAYQQLLKMPGVGPVVAARFLAYVKNPHRFGKRSRFIRYCGLGVAKKVSGGKAIARERLDRSGRRELKDISRKAAMAALRTKEANRFQRSYEQTWKNTGSEVHARLACQRKIMVTMLAIWRDGTAYQDNMGL